MGKYIMINSTCENEEEALKIANILLEKKLASCVQMNEIKSHYRWKENIEISNEILLKIKTKECLYEEVEKEIKDNHSYEVPQIIALPIIDGLDDYLNWIEKETK